MPSTVVKSVSDRPGIVVQGAPKGASVHVDGLDMGAVEKFDGEPGFLSIEPGTHSVVIKDGGTVLFERKVFVEGGLKILKVN